MSRAVNILVHYLRMGLEAKGYTWDYDNEAEVRSAVEDIVHEAVSQAKKEILKELQANKGKPRRVGGG